MIFDFKQIIDRRNLPPDKEVYSQLLETPIQPNVRYPATCIRPNSKPDLNPSLTFMEKNGQIVWKDWGTGLSGDVFEFLKLYFKDSYLQSIKKFMMLPKKELKHDVTATPRITLNLVFSEDAKGLDYFDEDYWAKYHIGLNTLQTYNVKKVDRLFDGISGNVLAKYSIINPIYAYTQLGKSKTSFQIYRPCASKQYKFYDKFQKDEEIIFGFDNLPWLGDTLVITKSLKDVMCLYEIGIDAIAPHSETTLLSYRVINSLKNRFTRIIVLFDNDDAGIRGAANYVNTYGLKAIFLPESKGCKDVSDFLKKYGLPHGANYLHELLK